MSVYTRNGKMGGELKLDYSWSKACWLASLHMKGLPFFFEVIQGLSNFREVWSKLMIPSSKPQEPLNFLEICQYWIGWNCFNFVRISIDSLTICPRNLISCRQNLNFFRLIVRLALWSRTITVRRCSKCWVTDILDRFLPAIPDFLHQPLESGRRIFYSKGHNIEMIQSRISDESSFSFAIRIHGHLPVSTI